MTKTRSDNDVTDHTNMDYVENETQVPSPMELGVVFDKNQIGQ